MKMEIKKLRILGIFFFFFDGSGGFFFIVRLSLSSLLRLLNFKETDGLGT